MTGAGSLLRLIRNGEAVTRADLVRRTGLARSTVAQRLDALLEFVRRFDRGVEIFVRGDARAIEGLFEALDRLEPETADRLWALLGELGPDDMARALDALAKLPPAAARRLIGLADQPVLQKLIGVR